MVIFPDTIADEGTVMVHSQNTSVADGTVMGSGRPVGLALVAVGVFLALFEKVSLVESNQLVFSDQKLGFVGDKHQVPLDLSELLHIALDLLLQVDFGSHLLSIQLLLFVEGYISFHEARVLEVRLQKTHRAEKDAEGEENSVENGVGTIQVENVFDVEDVERDCEDRDHQKHN